nr:MAG TPA: type I neck protein [Caudoviricetes sp.]
MRGMGAVFERLESITKEMLKDCEMVACETAASMERYAKENRVWTDRTGDARKGLRGVASRSSQAISAGIYQDMYGKTGKEYGYWLENGTKEVSGGVTFGEKYGILKPTRNAHAGMFFDGIEKACGQALKRQ